jgi:hypothetical protein
MMKYMFAAGAAALALGLAGTANAAASPCTPFNHYEHPSKAKQTKASLVQTFVSCNNPGGRTNNSTTETGTDTCYPAETIAAFNAQDNGNVPDGTWTWGPKSQGSLTFKAGNNKCHNSPDCSSTTMRTPSTCTSGQDLGHPQRERRRQRPRHRELACSYDPHRSCRAKVMTVFDFPTAFDIQAIDGKVSKKISATTIINPLNQPALPACTTIELVSVVIRDSNTNNFAAIGNYCRNVLEF